LNHQVKEAIVHPKYHRASKANDVALLLLKDEAIMTDMVRPICLWDDDYDIKKISGSKGMVRQL